jgi:L,D-peptidoglycan transpeptidase YkuD (ErfK/YbiS/YcfS/YnhG family)
MLRVDPAGWLDFAELHLRCALGKGGVSRHKREGDGATPVGCFPLRALFYRPDRLAAPHCPLPGRALAADDGWCDDPDHRDYNRLVKLPHGGRCEQLWRQDRVYDLVIPLGYNDDPPFSGLGSAIFLHVARPDYAPTEGCVALALPDLLSLVPRLTAGIAMEIAAPH